MHSPEFALIPSDHILLWNVDPGPSLAARRYIFELDVYVPPPKREEGIDIGIQFDILQPC